MTDYKYCPMCKSRFKWGETDGRKRQICSGCGWILYRNPVPVVACLAQDKKGRILLIKRGIEPCKGRWALPGGFIEVDESVDEAGVRELHEETGLRGKTGRLVGIYMQPSITYGFVMVTGMEFKTKEFETKNGDDAMDAAFFHLKDLPVIPFNSHRKLIKDWTRRA